VKAVLAILLAGAAGWPGQLLAQAQASVDAGRFEIRLGDRVAGTETFAIRRQGEQYMAVGRITIERDAESLRSVELGLRYDRAFLPRRYELRTLEGRRARIVASRTGNRLRLTTSTEEGERVTEFLAGDRLLLVERNVAHHYYFVIRHLLLEEARPGFELEALVPAAGRAFPLTLRGTTRASVTIGDEEVTATRYDLTLGDEPVRVWVDRAKVRILQVAAPRRRWTATRIPTE
jgi:hypothetical protein